MNHRVQSTVFVLLVLAALSPVFAVTHHIPADFSTIQAGLNAAASGDTVLVQPGTYVENINWPQVNGIKLISAGDSSNTIIDGNQTGRVITMESGGLVDTTTVVQGFTLRNAAGEWYGGGIYCDASSPSIRDCVISQNLAERYGGGIYCIYSSPVIEYSSINSNVAVHGDIGTGGGIYLAESSGYIHDCVLTENTATAHGGGCAIMNSSPIISDCTINNNSCSVSIAHGGGLYFYGSSPTISGCTITNNSGSYGGGLYFRESSVNLYSSIIGENTVDQFGGGILSKNSNADIHGCLIRENSSALDGGGVYFETTGSDSSNYSISDCEIVANDAMQGGGIYCDSHANPLIIRCRIIENTAQRGGGICCNHDSATRIIHCTIYSNIATGTGWNGQGGGGGIYLISEIPTITNTIVSHNTGVGVSAMFFAQNLNLTYCDLSNNEGGNFRSSEFRPVIGRKVGVNANGDSCDVYNNIAFDPRYMDPDNGDFRLRSNSPCIDAGDPDSPLDPDSTIADIGAFYFQTQSDISRQETSPVVSSWTLHPAYPNPFNAATIVRVTLPCSAELTVTVVNIAGQRVATLASGVYAAGSQAFSMDASMLASGLYFVHATVPGQLDQTQKVMLIR